HVQFSVNVHEQCCPQSQRREIASDIVPTGAGGQAEMTMPGGFGNGVSLGGGWVWYKGRRSAARTGKPGDGRGGSVPKKVYVPTGLIWAKTLSESPVISSGASDCGGAEACPDRETYHPSQAARDSPRLIGVWCWPRETGLRPRPALLWHSCASSI